MSVKRNLLEEDPRGLTKLKLLADERGLSGSQTRTDEGIRYTIELSTGVIEAIWTKAADRWRFAAAWVDLGDGSGAHKKRATEIVAVLEDIPTQEK